MHSHYSVNDGILFIDGIRMHPFSEGGPSSFAKRWVSFLRVRKGDKVLDTCTGLGYCAIEASRRGAWVTTIELDKEVIRASKTNELSNELFQNERIERRNDDSFQELRKFSSSTFDIIIHDPPRVSFAGELYSLEFYKQLARVLKRKGRMFHYVGYPGSKGGKNISKGVRERLLAAGFREVKWMEGGMGFLANR